MSIESELKKRIQRRMETQIAHFEKESNSFINEVVINTAETLTNETKKMFDAFITAFYTYPTISYSRHGEGIGTRTGHNLFMASQIKLDYRADGLPGMLHVYWNGSEMEPYRKADTEYVLGLVSRGIRGVDPKYSDRVREGSSQTWAFHYSSTYFDTRDDVTLNQAFDILEDQWTKVVGRVSAHYIVQAKRSKRYKFYHM